MASGSHSRENGSKTTSARGGRDGSIPCHGCLRYPCKALVNTFYSKLLKAFPELTSTSGGGGGETRSNLPLDALLLYWSELFRQYYFIHEVREPDWR